MPSDPFFDAVYRGAPDYYGRVVRPEFVAFVEALPAAARCLDLGCGQGRQALFAAGRGCRVHAVDYSEIAVRQLRQTANEAGLAITVEAGDARDLAPAPGSYDAIFMVSFLSHLVAADAARIAAASSGWLRPGGQVYVEAFTTADPAYRRAPDASETSPALQHFFPPEALRPLFAALTITDYREFIEDDLTHGPVHRHGVALLIARREP